MKKVFTISFLLLVTTIFYSAQAQSKSAAAPAVGEQQKIGYINVDSVLLNLKDYASQVKILEAFQKQLSAEFEVKNLEFEQKLKDYQENEKKYTEEQKQAKFADLQKLDQDLNQLRTN